MQKVLAAHLGLVLAIATSRALAAPQMPPQLPSCGGASLAPELVRAVTVERVIDGDTVVLRSGERVRLLGIDAPERGRPGANAATAHLIALLYARRGVTSRADILLRYDGRRRDRYRRLLGYLVRLDGLCINAELVRRGSVRVLRRYSFRWKRYFLTLEAAARAEGLGLWKDGADSQRRRTSAIAPRSPTAFPNRGLQRGARAGVPTVPTVPTGVTSATRTK